MKNLRKKIEERKLKEKQDFISLQMKEAFELEKENVVVLPITKGARNPPEGLWCLTTKVYFKGTTIISSKVYREEL